MQLKKAPLITPLPLFYTGPDLDSAPASLPCVIYLALSAKEALTVDPFNQPVLSLHAKPVRVFSVDLPFHGELMPAPEGIQRWAEAFAKGKDLLTPFLSDLETSLRILLQELKPAQVAICGLSRGGWIAAHIASRIEEITTFAAFAPLTHLSECLEFAPLKSSPLLPPLDLHFLACSLAKKKIKVYIGNRDARVHTDLCYSWVRSLVEEAFEAHRMRSPPIELVLKPSIGYLGHGTAPQTFEEGASWILQQMDTLP
jgi:esterase FrsA